MWLEHQWRASARDAFRPESVNVNLAKLAAAGCLQAALPALAFWMQWT
jgi:hypothetical protein